MNKKKIATSVAAVATAAALLLGGTFAWQSISQTALNEASDIINPGGRLHDDFDGTNKDVYVENFADEPIFARVRLDEYFEITINKGVEGAERTVEVIGSRVKDEDNNLILDDEGNIQYQYDIFEDYESDGEFDAAIERDAEENVVKSWWTWTTGGSTVYMPTFNMNKDSLQADVNGTYEGPDDTDGKVDGDDEDRYSDYVKYEEGDVLTAAEVYDADTNNLEDEGITTVEGQTHTAKMTGDATLMSMQEWIDAGSNEGPYWVYDKDGWVYWAQPIPGRNADGTTNATGLLLSGIELQDVMDDSWYYAINVVGQFITADDMGSKEDGTGFYDTDKGIPPSPEALALLEKIGVDVSGENGGDDAPAADGWYNEVDEMTAGTTETVEIDGIDWFVLAKQDGKALLQAAEPVGNIAVQIAYEYGSTVDYPDHDIDRWLSSNLTSSYPVYDGSGQITSYLDGFQTQLTEMAAYLVNNTIYTIDLFSTEGNRNTSVVYEELSRKVFIPAVADFASINYTTAVPGDATKDRTYGSSGLITKEMADIMLGNTNAAFITTRTSPTEFSNPLAYGSATWSLMTVTSNEGALTTGGVGAETAVDVFPMLWLDYETAIKDNPASGGDDSDAPEYDLLLCAPASKKDLDVAHITTLDKSLVLSLKEGTEGNLSSVKVMAAYDIDEDAETLESGVGYNYDASTQTLTLLKTETRYVMYAIVDATEDNMAAILYADEITSPFELRDASVTLTKTGYYDFKDVTLDGTPILVDSAGLNYEDSGLTDADVSISYIATGEAFVICVDKEGLNATLTATVTYTVEGNDQKQTATFPLILGNGGGDTTAPTVSFANAVQTNANVTITGLNNADFPLTVTAYNQTGLTESGEAVFADNAYSTFEIALADDGTLAFSEKSIHYVSGNPSYDASTGVLTFTYSASSDGLTDYDDENNGIGLKLVVADVTGNEGEYTLSWTYSDGCFVAGTQVLTVNGLMNVEDVAVGDMVYSIDMATGAKVVKPVTWVQENIYATATYTIYAGGEKITATAKHPFYVVGKEWVTVENLSVGDKLLDMNGNEITITNIVYTTLDKPVEVYNFTVDDTHTYLITETGILVHNKKFEDE